ncbi:hypothetical protein GF322_03890 [Candidatus Dependentiae bacterium]|nr:hypothetical protein [Candidatus Dependentiae bacterium]
MQKVLFILMPENYQDVEFSVPYGMLIDRGFEVDVAGLKPGTAIGVGGYKHMPNVHFDDLDEEILQKYDALVIPGGPDSEKYLWNNARLQDIIRYFYSSKKIIAAICHAVGALAQSRILVGKSATIYPSEDALEILKENDVKYISQGCVVLNDEKIITAQGPKFANEFSDAIIEMLEKEGTSPYVS